MPDTLRLAVVGCGSISKTHLNAIRDCDRAQLAAVVSRDEGRRTAAASAYAAPRAYGVYEEALADPDIDAIVLCTPSHLHLAQAMAALQAGKRVLVEKPMTEGYADGVTLVTEAERRGLTLMSAQCCRFLAACRKVREILQSNEIGRPLHLLYTNLSYSATHPAWYKNCRSVLMESSGSHTFDFFPWMADARPVRVYATAHNNSSDHDGDDDFVANIALENGAHAVTYTSACSRKPRKDLLVVCQKGTLVLDCWHTLRLDDRPLVEEPRDRAYQNTFDRQMAEFVDAALAGREPESSGRQVLPSLAVLDAAIESIRTGKAVNL
ncbi:MAG: Gfo/Idh/MocA family oxidoreductase [Candidatus Latescibacteria bacterium]|nr:Gfo/Idh/MocA family oxidoreductase [Candidatus Latescibacterota bacterium]